jgi:hypothetical protein
MLDIDRFVKDRMRKYDLWLPIGDEQHVAEVRLSDKI